MTNTVVIRVATRRSTVRVSDGARVIVVPVSGRPGEPGPPGDGSPVYGEVPAGVKNGTNLVFTLTETPRAGSVAVYRNGLREQLGVGFTVSGVTISFTSAPLSTDDITVDYLMEG